MGPVIDVHTHCLTEAWFRLLQQHGAPRYSVEQVRGGLRAIHLDGAPFMTPVPAMFDYASRIATMDRHGKRADAIALLQATQAKTMRYAIEHGVTFLDTTEANRFGDSETPMGKAVKGLRARGKIDVDRDKIGKAQAQHAEYVVRMLHHSAGLQSHRNAFAPQSGNRADVRVGARDEEQWADVHRRRHQDVDRLIERRLATFGAADPVRGDEPEFDVAGVQSVRVFDAGR